VTLNKMIEADVLAIGYQQAYVAEGKCGTWHKIRHIRPALPHGRYPSVFLELVCHMFYPTNSILGTYYGHISWLKRLRRVYLFFLMLIFFTNREPPHWKNAEIRISVEDSHLCMLQV
jgi:hypothetical protein